MPVVCLYKDRKKRYCYNYAIQGPFLWASSSVTSAPYSINRITFQYKAQSLDQSPVLLTSSLEPVLKVVQMHGGCRGWTTGNEWFVCDPKQKNTKHQMSSPFPVSPFNTMMLPGTKCLVAIWFPSKVLCVYVCFVNICLLIRFSYWTANSLIAIMVLIYFYISITQNMG